MSKWKNWSIGTKILAVAGGIVAGAGLAVLFGFVTMWLWNGLMPRIFGLPAIGYWEGWGLVILSSILFKSSPTHRGNHGDMRRKRMLRERMHQEEPDIDAEEKA